MTTTELVVKELQGMEPKFKEALPKHLPSKQFVRICTMAVQADPALLEADRTSLYMACLKAAADGLVLDGREAALTTFNTNVGTKAKPQYKKICQYMPMVAGIIKKIRNTGELSSIAAHVVYQNEKFRHILSPVETVEHEGVALAQERGKPIGVYAVARLKSGEYQYCVMRKDQVDAVKSVSKTSKIWDGPFGDQMWEKSAIRRLCKRLPSSTELSRVFDSDDEGYDFDEPPVDTDIIEPPKPAANKTTKAATVILEAASEPSKEGVFDPNRARFNKEEKAAEQDLF